MLLHQIKALNVPINKCKSKLWLYGSKVFTGTAVYDGTVMYVKTVANVRLYALKRKVGPFLSEKVSKE